MFLSPTTHAAARVWTPCVDSPFEKCTWELEFTVPHTLPDEPDLPPVLVVSSGELMEQVSLPFPLCPSERLLTARSSTRIRLTSPYSTTSRRVRPRFITSYLPPAHSKPTWSTKKKRR